MKVWDEYGGENFAMPILMYDKNEALRGRCRTVGDKQTMKRTTPQMILAGLLAGSLVMPALAQSSGSGIEFQSPQHRVAAGTTVKVKLLQDLNSSDARIGDRVRVQVAGNDSSGIPAGTIFNGRVATARPATPKAAGVLRINFGTSNGSASSYTASSSTATIQLVGTKPTSDKSQYGSIGAAAGALLGFSRKRKLGDAIGGAILGGAAGYGANQLQKKSASDVSLKRGDEISIKLTHPLTLRTQIVDSY